MKLYIGGEWVDSHSNRSFASINPATEEVLGRAPLGNREDVDRAVEAAEDAYVKWSSTPPPQRARVLFRAAEILREEKERLAALLTREMGKVLQEARGDVQEAIDIFEYMAGEGRRLFGHTTTSELKDKFCMTVRRPVGVFGLITPWNFPIAIPAWKIAPALICGNTMVFKPSSDTPLCAAELVKILERAGVPRGAVNLVTGSGGKAGSALVKSKRIKGISFTGSRDTGMYILKNAGIKKIGLELGGKNPVIVMDDADLELALEGVVWGAFGTTGQRCTAASRVIVHESVKERFEKALVRKALNLKVGNGLSPDVDVGPLINKRALEKVNRYVEIGVDEGADLLCGGREVNRRGFFYEPTVFSDAAGDMRIAQEEIFGPVVSLIEFQTLDEAIEIANSVRYGLSSSIYTESVRKAFKAIDGIEAGLTYVNASTIGSEVHLPFGGVKETGSTREAGILGIDEFSEVKTVYIDYSGKLQKAQIDVEP
jgi:aldehyde dehydrogenase (NAD+)